MRVVWLVSLGLLLVLTGCRATSRWAMDDPAYARKYGRPYTERGLDKHHRIGKQLVDARFVKDQGGLYVNTEFQGEPAHLGGEFGLIGFPEEWLSARIGLAGMLRDDGSGGALGGVDGGVRIFPPSRLAPFVGLGGFAGYRQEEVAVTVNGAPVGAVTKQGDTQAALYPEAGVGFWITGHLQLMANTRYYVTTNGRGDDHWTFGLGLTYLLGDHTDGTSSSRHPEAIEIDELVSPPRVVPRSEVLPATGNPAVDDRPFLEVGPAAVELPLESPPTDDLP